MLENIFSPDKTPPFLNCSSGSSSPQIRYHPAQQKRVWGGPLCPPSHRTDSRVTNQDSPYGRWDPARPSSTSSPGSPIRGRQGACSQRTQIHQPRVPRACPPPRLAQPPGSPSPADTPSLPGGVPLKPEPQPFTRLLVIHCSLKVNYEILFRVQLWGAFHFFLHENQLKTQLTCEE